MFKILLIDDEPLVLTGIKHLLNWHDLNCTLVGVANDGQQGLNMIEALLPDIVICDINMPVLNGMDVITTASSDAVFIMLTNLQDFELARTAMRHRAVEYLIKCQLNPAILEQAVQNAIRECEARQIIKYGQIMQQHRENLTSDTVRLAMIQFLFAQHHFSPTNHLQLLEDANALHAYGIISLTFSPQQNLDFDPAIEKRMVWMRELAENLAKRCFKQEMSFSFEMPSNSFVFFTWDNNQDTYHTLLHDFHSKLLNISQRMTNVPFHFLATDCFASNEQLPAFKENYHHAFDAQFNLELPCIFPQDIHTVPYESFNFTALQKQLIRALQTKNLPQCQQTIHALRENIRTNSYSRKALLHFTSNLLNELSEETFLGNQESELLFLRNALYSFVSKSLLIYWYSQLEQSCIQLLDISAENSNTIVSNVKQYIKANIENRLTLTDLARIAFVSPNYLSTQFKKEEGIGIPEYINKIKVEAACTLLQSGQYTIFEISEQLGFDSPNYFTRVFKRYIGTPPSEYQRSFVQH
ncbi:MAG: AraC family transcriptional regulator [Faecalibacterium sp.]